MRIRPTLARAGLAGAALGVVAFSAGSLVVYEAAGALPAVGGVVATFAAALAIGLWAGAPGARTDRPPTGRWIAAGAAVGLAGVFATVWMLGDGERLGHAGRAMALLFLVGVPVYAIGFLLPALAAWAAESEDDDDRGGAAGFGGAGAVALAALAGFALGAAAAGIFLLPGTRPGLLLLGTGALLTFPFLFPREFTGERTEERLLHEEDTPYGTVRVSEIVYPGNRQPELRLYVGEEIESGEQARSGAPTFGYVAAAERWLEEISFRGARYLFLGGGAYTLPRRVAEREPSARITVVELDPAVTRAAYRFFGVRPEHGIRSLHGDARRVAETLPAEAWDRVVVDVYDGSEAVPHHLVTAEALAMLRTRLSRSGVLLMNVIGVAKGDGACRLWSAVRTAAEVFPGIALYVHLDRDFPDRQNFLLAASADPNFHFPAAAGAFEPWPRDQWPRLAGATVLRDAGGAEAEGVAPEPLPRGRDEDAAPPDGERGARPARTRAE